MRVKVSGEIQESTFVPLTEKDGRKSGGYFKNIFVYEEPRVGRNGLLLAEGVCDPVVLKHPNELPKGPIELVLNVKPLWDGKSLDLTIEWVGSKQTKKGSEGRP